MAGEVYLVRYADDFLIMTQKQPDACMIEQALRDRFKKFSLTLHPEKTRTISFSRKEPENAKRQGRKPYTFEFLGFTHYWCCSLEGGWYMLSRRTSSKRFRRACRAMNDWLRSVRNWWKTKVWWLMLASKLRGHYQYYGVSGNSKMLKVYYYQVMRIVHKWLNRRSQRNRWSWERFTEYLEHYPLPLPHIVHKFYWPLTLLWNILKSRMWEIHKSGSVRGVEALSYGRILWHSSIEREEKQGIQSMPKWKRHITSTRPWGKVAKLGGP